MRINYKVLRIVNDDSRVFQMKFTNLLTILFFRFFFGFGHLFVTSICFCDTF